MPSLDVDVTAGPLEVTGKLGIELGRINDNYAAILHETRKRNEARARTPSDVRQFASAVCPTPTSPFGIALGDGPSAGFYWLLRRLIIGGVSWATVAAGTAEIYVTALSQGVGQAAAGYGTIASVSSLSDMVDQSATLPSKAFYSNRQVILQNGENLIVVVRTGTAGQTYAAAAQFEIHRTITELITYD